jgi:hypothetical protein
MRQIIYIDTEQIYQRACELRGFDAKPNEEFYESGTSSKYANTWRAWYKVNTERTGFSSGELEQAVSEWLKIPVPAKQGFTVSFIDQDVVIITDLEEAGVCDLNDADDEHHILPVTQFREWLYKWNADPLNRVMGTDEAAAIWGLSQSWVKQLCLDGKVEARRIGKHWILKRNQPNPKQL